jgi:hypothetical protein
MRRIILMAMVLAVTVAGCNRFPDNGLQISANLLPDDSCFVDPVQEERLLRGLWDVSYRNPGDGNPANYTIALQLQSYLVSNALEFQGDQANIQVDNYDITILLPDGSKPDLGGLNNPYRVRTSAVIPPTEPGGDPTPGVGAATGIRAEEYQDAVVALGVSEILLSIRAGGTTAGGFTQRSAPFLWPVTICQGCLNNCAAEDVNFCLPGQDVWAYCPP